jgi:UDP-glucose 4-epimerase
MRILVTGGAGYIGSHAVRALCEIGHEVSVVDDLSHGHLEAIDERADFYQESVSQLVQMLKILKKKEIEAIMHFAGDIEVAESVSNPIKYYHNNVGGGISLITAAREVGLKKFIFSSTAAVYGSPDDIPILESAPVCPVNPYGRSKLMVEQILGDAARAYGLGYVAFRYFNVAGASTDARLGELHWPETHLIPRILLSALSQRPTAMIFGTDYPTPDGTCVRDFVHVLDLVDAHILALNWIEPGMSRVFNLGSETGFSVREVIETCERITQREIPIEVKPRRPGDPPILIASRAKAVQELGWKPRYDNLAVMIEHAWRWHQKNGSKWKPRL